MLSAVAAPSYPWNWYVDYLWNYDHNSWVATVAYGFRIWAILAILPTVILCLLDVTSYVIARTLGDPTASTSHKSSFAQADPSKSDPNITDTAASLLVTAPSPLQEEGHGPISAVGGIADEPTATTAGGIEAHPATYFVDGEGEDDDGAARLAGVGVFSPIASMPGSPTLTRRRSFLGEEESGSVHSVVLPPPPPESEHGHGHERTASGGSGVNGGGESTSGESSFTLLEREESFEDPAAAHIRRRVPGPAGAED
ncbi:hypothetical protein BJY52DRAFT_1275965 [Lactarius psammicola]|nr:hypothetical protein BJY52DRAFT_1275965 [Lactarius psammicola]